MTPQVDDHYTKTKGQILVEITWNDIVQAGILAWVSYRRAIVRLSEPPQLGDEMGIKAELLPNAFFEVTGLVQKCKPIAEVEGAHEVELRFTRIFPSALAVLQTYLDQEMERRRDPRVHVELPVTLPSESKKMNRPGSTVNLSRGGMFVRTEMPAPLGTKIKIKIDLGGDHGGVVVVDGEVAYVLPLTKAIHLGRSPGLGLRFLSFHDDGEQRLSDFVHALEIELKRDEGLELPPEKDKPVGTRRVKSASGLIQQSENRSGTVPNRNDVPKKVSHDNGD